MAASDAIICKMFYVNVIEMLKKCASMGNS